MADLDLPGIVREQTETGFDFFVIGEIAVGYHGYVRATKDVDVVPSPEAPNLDRLQWNGLWEEMSGGAVSDEVAGMPVKIVGFPDLKRLKELTGRPEDLTDLESLREARGE